MKAYLPTYKLEAPKLLKLIIINYLFSNGEAHFKNFSILETTMGDYRLSSAYELLNSRMHFDTKDFALDHGLLPGNLAQGKISRQFLKLAGNTEISEKIFSVIMTMMLSKSDVLEKMITASFLNDSSKRNYWQAYNGRLKQLLKA
jgi:serine/threonine-protein kinase HipA